MSDVANPNSFTVDPPASGGVTLTQEQYDEVQAVIAAHNATVAQNALLVQQLTELRGRQGVQATTGNFTTHVVAPDEEHNISLVGERTGLDPALVYAHNSVTLEGNAIARGFRDAEGGRLVWAGTSLRIPVAA